jgi:pyruvate formate lyase activating enzyme
VETGLIFDIQGHSVHDGPGCRTLVFLSGCPLHCAWCANPEGQLLRPRLMYRAQKCAPTHYRCVQACPHDAVRVEEGGRPPLLRFDRARCDRCEGLECASACMHEALKIAGCAYTVDELMRVLRRDQGFWGNGGGVTFSGGEPLVQAKFLLTMLRRCRASYIHTSVETSAHVETELLLDILKWTDWLFVDIKHMDSAAHRAETGAGNELILNNIAAVAAVGAGWEGRLVVRVPIVPGYNDTADNLQATASFLMAHHLREINLLPFHRLGHSKYEQLGLDYPYAGTGSPSPEAMQAHQRIFATAGLQCYVGFETPF